MSTCFIFGALPVKKPAALPEAGDFVIAADRGLLAAEKLGITPDIIIGDFDSLMQSRKLSAPDDRDKTERYGEEWEKHRQKYGDMQ